jgi:glycosyltransferase involved in cell wall biosynthesis
MVTTFYPPYSFGGDGVYVHRLSNALARRGHRVDVIHCIDSYQMFARETPSDPAVNHPNVHVHELRSRWGILSPLVTHQTGRPYLKTAALKRILEDSFDVIHYHNISLIGGPEILRFGDGIKLYTTHEYWLICPTSSLFKFNRETCRERECFRCALSHRRPPQLWREFGSIDTALSNVDAFLSPSLSCIALHKSAGVRGRFIHLPGFAPRVAAEPIPGAGSPPYFLFVGRLEKGKGLHTVIPLFRDGIPARLLIAGEGSERDALRRMAGGASNIEFLGFVPGSRLAHLYSGAVAVIVPSLWNETFSLVTAEAFQQGTPVIGRNIGGVAELLEQSGAGIGYLTDDELAAAASRLLEDGALRDELGQRGRAAYDQYWSEETHITKYLAVVDELSAGPSISRAAASGV